MIKSESELHINLVTQLLHWLEASKGYTVKAADLDGYTQPEMVENGGNVGDGEDKQPDIDAYDDAAGVRVRGEAKTGDGDLEMPHTETQFRLFSNLHNSAKKSSLLYIVVPSAKFEDLQVVLQELELLGKPNVIPVKSGKF